MIQLKEKQLLRTDHGSQRFPVKEEKRVEDFIIIIEGGKFVEKKKKVTKAAASDTPAIRRLISVSHGSPAGHYSRKDLRSPTEG
jgi:hypothetical protein